MLTEDIFLRIGSFTLYTLGVALALGFLTATVVAIPETRRRGIRRRTVLDLMLWLMLVTVIGARIVAIIAQWETYIATPLRLFSMPSDGLSYYGGLTVGVVVLAIFALRHNLRFWLVADTLAPPAALGIVAALAVAFSTNVLRLQAGGGGGGLPWVSIVLFTVAYAGTTVLWRWRHRVRFEGELALLFLAMDSIIRIVIGYGWALGDGPYSSVRSSFVTLAAVTTLWFVRRGAAQRDQAVEPFSQQGGKRRSTRWVVGYVMLIGLMLMRYRLSA